MLDESGRDLRLLRELLALPKSVKVTDHQTLNRSTYVCMYVCMYGMYGIRGKIRWRLKHNHNSDIERRFFSCCLIALTAEGKSQKAKVPKYPPITPPSTDLHTSRHHRCPFDYLSCCITYQLRTQQRLCLPPTVCKQQHEICHAIPAEYLLVHQRSSEISISRKSYVSAIIP